MPLLAVRTTNRCFIAAVLILMLQLSRLVSCWSHAVKRSSFTSLIKTSIRKRNLSIRRSHVVMMPEGPEVLFLVDELQGAVGKRLVNLQVLSGRYRQNGPPHGFVDFASTMTRHVPGQEAEEKVDIIKKVDCKGKFIYFVLDDGGKQEHHDPTFQRTIFVTLGMTGKFVSEKINQQDNRFARWSLELLDMKTKKTSKIYYHDQRGFGTLKFCLRQSQLDEKLASLGPDLLSSHTDKYDFINIASAQNQDLNICKFLMNQNKLCGIGNYLLAEGLYKAKIDPFASLYELDRRQLENLYHALSSTAHASYLEHSSRNDRGRSQNLDTSEGGFLQCYGRETCAKGDPVIKEINGPHDRTIWYTEKQLFMPRHERIAGIVPPKQPEGLFGHSGDDDISTSVFNQLTDPSWRAVLVDTEAFESFEGLDTFLETEREQGAVIYPPQGDIFSALNMCPFDKVKVVIVGQDPYHGPGQGNGLAFSVRPGVRPPPSLQNIAREAMSDVGIKEPRHGNLECWAKQGVLLLNTVLTVRKGEANSHANQGWEEFTDLIIQQLNDENENLVFLLWGNPAAKKAKRVDEGRHHIIKTSHPSPLGATKSASPFLSSKCFSRCNEFLVSDGKDPINWNIL